MEPKLLTISFTGDQCKYLTRLRAIAGPEGKEAGPRGLRRRGSPPQGTREASSEAAQEICWLLLGRAPRDKNLRVTPRKSTLETRDRHMGSDLKGGDRLGPVPRLRKILQSKAVPGRVVTHSPGWGWDGGPSSFTAPKESSQNLQCVLSEPQLFRAGHGGT